MCMEQCCSWLLPMLEILGKQSLGGSVFLSPSCLVISYGLGWEKSFSRMRFSAVGSSVWLEIVVPGVCWCPLLSCTQAAAQ